MRLPPEGEGGRSVSARMLWSCSEVVRRIRAMKAEVFDYHETWSQDQVLLAGHHQATGRERHLILRRVLHKVIRVRLNVVPPRLHRDP
jgi:hypothetical protein